MTEHAAGTTATTHVVFIIDSSGSMGSIRDETIELVNAQLNEVRNATRAGRSTASFVTFGTESRPIIHYVGQALETLRPLTHESYQPDGMTPMLDAVGWAVEVIEQQLVDPAEDYSVLVNIVSDGHENHSGQWQHTVPAEQRHRTYTPDEIKAQVCGLEQAGRWTFTFLGANLNLQQLCEQLGLRRQNVTEFESSKRGVSYASDRMRMSSRRYMESKLTGKRRMDNFYGEDGVVDGADQRLDNRGLAADLMLNCRLGIQLREPLTPPAPLPVNPQLWERVEGMMLGLAIGDALGNTSQSLNPDERRALHGEIRDYLPNRHAGMQPVGLPSDDTQMSYWTLDQLTKDRGLDPAQLAQRFASSGEIFGIGNTVRSFLRHLHAGDPWFRCGQHSAGNGALMRIAPAIVPYLSNPDEGLWADTILMTAITHRDPSAQLCSLAFVHLLWQLLGMTAPPAPEWWLTSLRQFLERADDGRQTFVPRGGDWAGKQFDHLADYLDATAGSALASSQSTLEACNSWWSGAFVLETFASAIYILMRHAHDPEEAIVRAVNDTRDNDTVAAIVGAAVGALHGRKRLPSRWQKGLLGRTGADDDGRVFAILSEAKAVWLHGAQVNT